MIANGSGALFGLIIFWNSITVMVAQPCEYTKNHLKRVSLKE